MRARKQLVVAVLALPLMAGVAACGELQEAQQGLDQAKKNIDQAQQRLSAAQACAKALKVSQFTPNFSDPQQAREQARAKADELGRLAQQTSDQTLKQNLLDVRDSVERVATGEITLDNSAQWIQEQLTRTQRVIGTCQQITG